MRIGTDPLLLNQDGDEATIFVDSGDSVTYAYGRSSVPLGTLAAGQSATILGPAWVWSAGQSNVHLTEAQLRGVDRVTARQGAEPIWNSSTQQGEWGEPKQVDWRHFVSDGKDYRWRGYKLTGGSIPAAGATQISGIPLRDTTYGFDVGTTIRAGMWIFIYKSAGQFATLVTGVSDNGSTATVQLLDPIPGSFTPSGTIFWGWSLDNLGDHLAEIDTAGFGTHQYRVHGIIRPRPFEMHAAMFAGDGFLHTGGWRMGSGGPSNLLQSGSVVWQFPRLDVSGGVVTTRSDPFPDQMRMFDRIPTGQGTSYPGPFIIKDLAFEAPEADLTYGPSNTALAYTGGYAIKMALADDTWCGMQDGCMIDNVQLASFYDGGLRLSYCGAGNIGLIRPRHCGNYGVDVNTDGFAWQSWNIGAVISDGCGLGAIRFKSGNNYDSVNVGFVKSETNPNGNFRKNGTTLPNGQTTFQEQAVVFEDCSNLEARLGHVMHLSSVTSPAIKAPGPAVLIKDTGGLGRRPKLSQVHARVRMKGTETDTTLNTVAIDDQPASCVRGAATVGVLNLGTWRGHYPPDAAPPRDPTAPSTGETPFPRGEMGSMGIASGAVKRTNWMAQTSLTASKVVLFTQTAAAGTAPTLFRCGIEDIDETAWTPTLSTGVTANDTSLFTTGNTAYTINLSATKKIFAGKWYGFQFITVGSWGTTQPTFAGRSNSAAAAQNSTPPIGGQQSGQTDLVSSATRSAAYATTVASTPYFELQA